MGTGIWDRRIPLTCNCIINLKKNGDKDAKKNPTDLTAVESLGTLAPQPEKMHFGFQDKDEESEIHSESGMVHFLRDLQHYYEGTWNKGCASLLSS